MIKVVFDSKIVVERNERNPKRFPQLRNTRNESLPQNLESPIAISQEKLQDLTYFYEPAFLSVKLANDSIQKLQFMTMDNVKS